MRDKNMGNDTCLGCGQKSFTARIVTEALDIVGAEVMKKNPRIGADKLNLRGGTLIKQHGARVSGIILLRYIVHSSPILAGHIAAVKSYRSTARVL